MEFYKNLFVQDKRTMFQETAKYIFNHYRHLMSTQEKLAWRHYASTIKLADNENPAMTRMYKKKGWFSDEPEVLELLKDGYDKFEMKTAKRILFTNEDIVLNKCPKCERLARTPEAKQCRHCGYDWHEMK